MEIKLGGVLTKDEYLHATKLNSHRISSRSRIRIDLWILFFIAGFMLLATGIWLFSTNQDSSSISLSLTLFGLFLIEGLVY
jgi:hypothetical protein